MFNNGSLFGDPSSNSYQIGNLSKWNRINALIPFPTTLTACKADGTSDDTITLQNLINYCFTNKISLYLPRGIYITSNTITLKQVNIEGEGKDLTYIQYNGASSVDIMDTDTTSWLNYIKLSNFTIKNTGNGVNGLVLTQTGNSSFDMLKFDGMKGTGLVVDHDCYQNKFGTIFITNCAVDGLYLKGFTNNGIDDGSDYTYRCNSNQFDKIYITCFGRYGLNMNQCAGNIFNNTDIEIQTGSGSIAFYLHNCRLNQFNTPWSEMNGKGLCVKIDGLDIAYSSDNKFIGGQLTAHASTDTLTQTAINVVTSARNMFIGVALVRALTGYYFGSTAQANVIENPSYLTVTNQVTDSGTNNKYDIIAMLGLGGIVASGSNANGRYIQCSDGTQICWQPSALTLTYAATTTISVGWTFPMSFVDTNVTVIGGFDAPPSGKRSVSFPAVTLNDKNSATIKMLNDSATTYVSGDTATAKPMAIGRWK